ncbi:MAG TPA: DUF4130 domain-containing protein [Methanothrix sp.]|nr:DUF4130 domain-containing protein [Methanothrix sp.]
MRIPDDFLHYLSAHEDCSEQLLFRARNLSAEDLEVSTDAEVMRIKKMVHSVLTEVHRMEAFVRLRPLGPCVLYGYLKPRHRIGEIICDFFARRNPQTIVVLGNGHESWISFNYGGKTLRKRGAKMAETLEELKSFFNCSEEGRDVKDIWQAYYDSQYRPCHKSTKSYHTRMPRRDQKAAGLRMVQNKSIVTLDDF